MAARLIFKPKTGKSNGIKELLTVLRELSSTSKTPNYEVSFELDRNRLRMMAQPSKWLQPKSVAESVVVYDFDPQAYDLQLSEPLNERPRDSEFVMSLRLQVKNICRIIAFMKKSLSMIVLCFGNDSKGSLEIHCSGTSTHFDISYQPTEPQELEFTMSNYHLIEQITQDYYDVLQGWNFGDIVLLPDTIEFREYQGTACVKSIRLNKTWLKKYNFEQLMTKMSGRNVIRFNGIEFGRAFRYARKMKKSAVSIYVELDSTGEDCQLVFEVVHDGSRYLRNVSSSLLKLTVAANDRIRNQVPKRDDNEVHAVRVKQLHVPESPPSEHNTHQVKVSHEPNPHESLHQIIGRPVEPRPHTIKREVPEGKIEEESDSSDSSEQDREWKLLAKVKDPEQDYM